MSSNAPRNSRAAADFGDWVDAVAALAGEPLAVLDCDFRVAAASAAFHEMLGLTEAAVGTCLYTLQGGIFDHLDLRAALHDCAAGTGAARRVEIASASKRFAIQAHSFSAGGLNRFILLSMRGLDPESPVLIPQTPAGLIRSDAEGNRISGDATAEAICGVASKEMCGEGWLRHTCAQQIAAFREKLKDARETNHAATVEMRFVPPGRAPVWARVIMIPVDRGFIFTLQDISMRKLMEERLFHSQKMETIGRLAGGVAHDFNTVLTAISSYAEQVESGVPDSSPAIQAAARIRKLVDQAALITRELVTLGRKQVAAARLLNLNDVLRDMNDPLFRTLANSIEIKLELDLRLNMVMADLAQMRQMILNLAVNACDAMGSSGTLSISTRNAAISAAGDGMAPGAYVLLEVSDTGAG